MNFSSFADRISLETNAIRQFIYLLECLRVGLPPDWGRPWLRFSSGSCCRRATWCAMWTLFSYRVCCWLWAEWGSRWDLGSAVCKTGLGPGSPGQPAVDKKQYLKQMMIPVSQYKLLKIKAKDKVGFLHCSCYVWCRKLYSKGVNTVKNSCQHLRNRWFITTRYTKVETSIFSEAITSGNNLIQLHVNS